MKRKEKELKMMLGGKGCKTTCKVLSVVSIIIEIIFIIAAVAVSISGIVIGLGHNDLNLNEMIASVNTELENSGVTITGSAIENFMSFSHGQQVSFILFGIAVAAVVFIFMSIVARNVYKIFKNLAHDKTPFKLENVDLLQKIAVWIFISTAMIDVSSAVLSGVLNNGAMRLSISLSYYAVGFMLLVLAVVFRHGCELEKKARK